MMLSTIKMELNAAVFAFAVVAAQPGIAQEISDHSHGSHMMGSGHMWGGGWWMFLGPLWIIVSLGVIIVAIVLLIRWLGAGGLGRPEHAKPTGKEPIDILKERFARGEIDKEDFEERRKLLE
jgi:putative membrane protein